MFPNRTWFYDKESQNAEGLYGEETDLPALIPPEDNYAVVGRDEIALLPTGEVTTIEPTNETKRFIPLASTGLQDNEGNEIIEGHILESVKDPIAQNGPYAVRWVETTCEFCMYPSTYKLTVNRSVEIIGHALTRPELAPEEFNILDYFRLKD